MNIQLLGLVITPLHPCVGASPDGIHKYACHGDVLLEIKCPFVHRYKALDQIIAADKDGKFIIQAARTVNKSYQYYSQDQFQMYLCGTASCDLVVHTTREFDICPIAFDYDCTVIVIRKAETFFEMYIFPEFASKDIETGLLAKHTSHWCTCQTPELGLMIACANNQCNIKNYHLSCVGLKRRKKNWQCPQCFSIKAEGKHQSLISLSFIYIQCIIFE